MFAFEYFFLHKPKQKTFHVYSYEIGNLAFFKIKFIMKLILLKKHNEIATEIYFDYFMFIFRVNVKLGKLIFSFCVCLIPFTHIAYIYQPKMQIFATNN